LAWSEPFGTWLPFEVTAKQATVLIETGVASNGRQAVEREVVIPPVPKPTIKEKIQLLKQKD